MKKENRVTKADKVQWALGRFPESARGLFFGGKKYLAEHVEIYQRVHHKKSASSDVSLTPTEAMVAKREVEPDYGDF